METSMINENKQDNYKGSHIEAETKWLQFCRQQFQGPFRE